MKQIIGIVGSGMIGRDPWDPTCWSRSGYNLFTSLKQHGLLKRAVGVEVPFIIRAPLMLKNFSTPKRRWAQKFNLDPLYYSQLTKAIASASAEHNFEKDCVVLQIGGHYNAAKATGLPTYSYHDGNISGLMNSPYFSKDLMKYAQKAFAFEKNVYKDMTKIFVMSEYWKKSFINDFDVPKEKVVNVGFGVNIDIPQKIEKNPTNKNIVFIGVAFERKGGDALVRAFDHVVSLARHQDAKLHIVGPKEIPSILKDNKQFKNIIYHGHLSREDESQKKLLEQILTEGTVFVLPSRYEPFGNAALESMLYGMPAITTNDWSFPDFVIPEQTGILLNKQGDEVELSESMIYYLDNPEICIQHGQNGYNLVVNKYTWENTIKNIENAIVK